MNIRKRRRPSAARNHANGSLGIESLEARQLLAGDLVAEWNADLIEGLEDGALIESWADTSGGREAARNGTPTLAVGAIGGRNAVAFDPSDGADSLDVSAANSPLSLADDFSLSVVFKTQGPTAGANGDWFQNTGIVDANQLGLGRDWGLTINSAGQLSSGMTGGFGQPRETVYSTESSLNDGETHIAVVTRSGGTLSIYVDGNAATTITDADAQSRASEKLRFGDVLAGDSKPFDGLIANVRTYDGSLTAEEASAVHAELFAYYNNSAPIAVDDNYTTAEDTLLFLVPANQGVLANDSDADGDPMTAELVEGTAHGTINLLPNGSFVYDSDNDFSGTDTFTYRVTNFLISEIATATINVTPVYDPVRTVPDNYRARPGQTINIPSLVGVLANDVNPDRADMTAVLVDDVPNGALTFNADGSFRYEPQGFAGTTTFTYQADDGTGLSAVTPVTLAITSPPVGNPDTLQATEDTLLTLSGAAGIFANDVDAEGDPLTARLVQDVSNGVLALGENGQVIYTPNQDFNGIDTFSYIVSDGYDDVGPIDVTINVAQVNDAPTTTADAYYTRPGTPLTVTSDQGLLANDFDVESADLSATLAQAPTNGTVQVNADGSLTYTPNAGFLGDDSFTYQASDGTNTTPATTVTIAIVEQPFVISEFMAINSDTIDTRTKLMPEDRFRGERISPDWIEVQNQLPLDFDIGGLHLTDDPDDLTRWTFPTGTILPAGGRIVVFASGLDVTDTQLDSEEFYHTNFKLSSDGGFLAVTAEDGTILQAYEDYPKQFGDLSYGIIDGTGTGYMLTTTLGEPNSGEIRTGLVDGPTIDTEHGFFTEPVQVTITNADATATLRYTLDGSTPSETNGEVYTGPITIDKTTVVRAAATKVGLLPSRVDTRSYVFLDDILTQSLDGEPQEGWPERWGSNRTDYGMDPDIVNDDEWGPQMKDALTQIPSMSIVTDLDNLFDSRTGIYARPSMDGEAAERPASLELLNPDGSVGFQHNIGLRIRGGFSRSTNNPKHAFRLFFDSLHGEGRLNFPLFAEDGADSFAKVDLRTTQNYSWAFQGNNRNAFLRDIFSRDLQRQMGSPSTRGEFYHLYINGMYFGLFQTDERPEANFGASYMGGDPEDYDVIHNDPRANGATNGNTEAYERLWAKFRQDGGLSDENIEDYYRTQGMNMDGTRNPEFERLLDVDNLIDYMIITYYTSDADGPGSKFTRPGLNNYFAVYNRENPDGFKFVEHDSEHSLDTGNAAGANYNMVTPFVNNGRTFGNFNPHYMHEQLAQTNSDYLQKFVDRVHEVFQDDGLLGDDNVIKILRDRAAEFDMAIIAESARWGDAQRASRPFTKNDWVNAVNNVVRWVTSRRGGRGRRFEVLEQLRGVDWYPSDDHVAPTFSQNGGRVDAGFQLGISAPAGTLYYTADGTDPRASGGGVSDAAIQLAPGSMVTVDSGGFVNARVLLNDVWSPITSEQFFVEPLASIENLRISEVHYNPAQPSVAAREAGFTDKDDFEFIEVVNISDTTIDLSSARLSQTTVDGDDEGVVFDFSKGSIAKLAPGERIVVVENAAAFQFRYGDGIPVAGQWSGGLSNSGETLTLSGDGDSVLQFKYSDMWHPSTDGDGFSLEVNQPSSADLASWNVGASWKPSPSVGGTPGRGSVIPGDSNGDGLFDSSDLILVFQAAEYEDGIAGNSTFAEGDWNGDGDFDSSDIILAFQTGMYEKEAAVAAGIRSDASATNDRPIRRRATLNVIARDTIFANATDSNEVAAAFDDADDWDDDSAFVS